MHLKIIDELIVVVETIFSFFLFAFSPFYCLLIYKFLKRSKVEKGHTKKQKRKRQQNEKMIMYFQSHLLTLSSARFDKH